MKRFSALLTAALVGLGLGQSAAAAFDSQHDVEALTAVLQRPIPAEWVTKARELDDQLMLDGEINGQRVYLVTDERLSMLEEIVEGLLISMGEDPSRWIVRVFDTEPKIVNAFVTGGQYIYVFTGFLDEAQSEDEIAFVLGHELGHSLLQHQERRSQDWTQLLATLAAVAAASNGSDSLDALSQVLRSDYSQTDEQEADAIGVAIATRAGYNALRGADFFSRQARAEEAAAEEWRQYGDELNAIRATLEQDRVDCEYLLANWPLFPTQELISLREQKCDTYESRRVAYNQALAQYNAANAQQNIDEIVSTHPDSRSRVAAVAALVDFLRGRRELHTLSAHEQAHRVMTALRNVDSVLLIGAASNMPRPDQRPLTRTGDLRALSEAKKSR